MNTDADVVQRYQRRLEEQQTYVPGNRMGLQGSLADTRAAAQQGQPQRVDVGATNVFTGRGAEFKAQNTYTGVTTIASGATLTVNNDNARTWGASGMYSDNYTTAAVLTPADAAGLAGLDVQIPQRGVLYRFTTPLGQPDITALPVSAPLVLGLQRLLGVLVAVVVLRIVWRFFADGRGAKFAGSRSGALLLVVVGLFSMIFVILPLAGLFCFVLGIGLLVRRLFVSTPRSIA
jgi:hypothetical protein